MDTEAHARDAGADDDPGPWRAQLLDLVRAGSGGLLFGVPLLYTMEVWWTGTHTEPHQMLVVLGLLVVPLFALNRTSGFRNRRDVRARDAADDTVEALAVGIVVTFAVLVLVREITLDTGLEPALGKVVYECVPFCLGAGVARHFLQGRRSGDDADSSGGDGSGEGDDLAETPAGRQLHPTVADLGATALGAVFVALSIAPTDEVQLIASATTPRWLLAVVGGSLLTSYAIVFVAGFGDQESRHTQEGLFQRPVTETVVSYLVSLAVAGALLSLFQRGDLPGPELLAQSVVLGFPAAIGGAAGRLAV